MHKRILNYTTDDFARFPKVTDCVYCFNPKGLDAIVEGEEIICPSFDLSDNLDQAIDTVFEQLEKDGKDVATVVVMQTPLGTSVFGYGTQYRKNLAHIDLDLDLMADE